MNSADRITIRSAVGLYYPAGLSKPNCDVYVAVKAEKEIVDLGAALLEERPMINIAVRSHMLFSLSSFLYLPFILQITYSLLSQILYVCELGKNKS